ncbi:MAG: hypothetical protein AAFP02_07830, partial [Bacteroidota bacterium]
LVEQKIKYAITETYGENGLIINQFKLESIRDNSEIFKDLVNDYVEIKSNNFDTALAADDIAISALQQKLQENTRERDAIIKELLLLKAKTKQAN